MMKLDPRISFSLRAALRGNFRPAIGFGRNFIWAITHRGCGCCGGPREDWHRRYCSACQWQRIVYGLLDGVGR